MEDAVRAMDVCVHLPSRRRCLAVAGRLDGTVECVDGDDRPFACPAGELLSYRHPAFDEAVRRCEVGGR